MSDNMDMVQMNSGFFTNKARPAAVASHLSDASLSRLSIRAGKHLRIAVTALSWDNHLVSATSFSLMLGVPSIN